MKRVYHPSLPAWQDVPDKDVDAWADAGWRKTKPKHIDDGDVLPVGDYTPPVELDATEPPSADTAEADKGGK